MIYQWVRLVVGRPRRGPSLRHRNSVQSPGVPGARRLRRKPHLVRPPRSARQQARANNYNHNSHSNSPCCSRFHRATAPSLLKHFRDCIKDAPRELYANVLLTAGPADKDSLVVIQICYVGPKAKGVEYLQAISSWDGERCLLNEVNEKSFLNQQDSVAQVLRGKRESFSICEVDGSWKHGRLTPGGWLGHSGEAVVPALCAHHVADRRDYQPDGPGLREHSYRMQYVPLRSIVNLSL